MPAGKATDTVPLNWLVQFSCTHILIEYFAEGRHPTDLSRYSRTGRKGK